MRFKRGLAFLALLEALRPADARMAPARFLLIPCLRAMLSATALNPGCVFIYTY